MSTPIVWPPRSGRLLQLRRRRTRWGLVLLLLLLFTAGVLVGHLGRSGDASAVSIRRLVVVDALDRCLLDLGDEQALVAEVEADASRAWTMVGGYEKRRSEALVGLVGVLLVNPALCSIPSLGVAPAPAWRVDVRPPEFAHLP